MGLMQFTFRKNILERKGKKKKKMCEIFFIDDFIYNNDRCNLFYSN